MIHKPFDLIFSYQGRSVRLSFENERNLNEFYNGFLQTEKAKKLMGRDGHFIELVSSLRNTFAERGSLFFYKFYNFLLVEFEDVRIHSIDVRAKQNGQDFSINRKAKATEEHDEG